MFMGIGKLNTVLAASAFLLSSIFSCSSSSEPAFEGGIRNVTYVGLASNPADQTPIGGVNDSGFLDYVNPTGGSSGTDSEFSGTTESADGIDDHPGAITNSVWTLQMDWSFAEPDCETVPNLISEPGAQIGSSGAIFRWHCLM